MVAAVRPTWEWAGIFDSRHWTCAFCVAAWLAWRSGRSASGSTGRVRRRFAAGLILLASGQLACDLLQWAGWDPFDLVRPVADALRESGLPPHRLELEITESVLMRDTDKVLATADRLKVLGVRLAIDDFGTGCSSLAYLRRLSVNKLKIDQSFVRNALESKSTTAIVRAIIEMARALELEVVAEGIETDAERAFLESAQCAMGQGDLFARPMPADQFEAFLAGRGTTPTRDSEAQALAGPADPGRVFSPSGLDGAGRPAR